MMLCNDGPRTQTAAPACASDEGAATPDQTADANFRPFVRMHCMMRDTFGILVGQRYMVQFHFSTGDATHRCVNPLSLMSLVFGSRAHVELLRRSPDVLDYIITNDKGATEMEVNFAGDGNEFTPQSRRWHEQWDLLPIVVPIIQPPQGACYVLKLGVGKAIRPGGNYYVYCMVKTGAAPW